MKLIELTKGHFAIVDDQDFELLNKLKWQASGPKSNNAFYAVSRGGIRMHRIIMDCPEDMIVDHINGNGLDNRRSNLRIGTQSLNCVNRKRTPGANLRGARKKKNRWQAYIKIHGKQKSLGYFSTEIEAHNAYMAAAAKEYGNWMPLPKGPEDV